VRPAPPPARRASRQHPRRRRDSRNRSMAASGMSSSKHSCSPKPLRHRSWPTVGAGSTTHSAAFGLQGLSPLEAAQQGVVACPHPPALKRPGLTKGVTSNQFPTIDKLAKRLQRVNCHRQQQHLKFPLITLELENLALNIKRLWGLNHRLLEGAQ